MNLKSRARKKELNKNKNFVWLLVITGTLWLLSAIVIYFVDPQITLAVPVFFPVFFLNLFFSFTLLLKHTRRALIISVAINSFLVLRYFGVGNIITLILIVGIAVAIEIYSSILV